MSWRERWAHQVHEDFGKRFAWGTHDCCTFARQAVKTITGKWISLPGYYSRVEAREALTQRETSISDWVTLCLGKPEETPREDVPAIVMLKATPTHLICFGEDGDGPLGVYVDGKIYTPSRLGLGTGEPTDIIKVWNLNPS